MLTVEMMLQGHPHVSLSCGSEENESVMRERGSVSIICAIKHDQLPVRGYLYDETPSRDAY